MRFSAFTAAAFLVSGLTTVFAETFLVKVGNNATLLYDPPSIQAKVGDVVSFQFMSKNHTVSQSSFATPCTANPNGVNSGFQFIPANTTVFPVWSFTVSNDTTPIWFYCAQAPHCSLGMVFAINPTAQKTFDMYHANALASAPPPASSGAASSTSGYGSAAGGYGGGAYGGTAPSGSGSVPTTSPTVAVTAQGTAAAANAGTASDTLPQNGAMSRAVGWPMLLGSMLIGVLVL